MYDNEKEKEEKQNEDIVEKVEKTPVDDAQDVLDAVSPVEGNNDSDSVEKEKHKDVSSGDSAVDVSTGDSSSEDVSTGDVSAGDVSAGDSSSKTPVYVIPIDDISEITESLTGCNCRSDVLLWDSDISEYNITDGLLFLILVTLVISIVVRRY